MATNLHTVCFDISIIHLHLCGHGCFYGRHELVPPTLREPKCKLRNCGRAFAETTPRFYCQEWNLASIITYLCFILCSQVPIEREAKTSTGVSRLCHTHPCLIPSISPRSYKLRRFPPPPRIAYECWSRFSNAARLHQQWTP